jgi:L-alanine-DL-glutamate epimerase-like enolase superfamily enzyme
MKIAAVTTTLLRIPLKAKVAPSSLGGQPFTGLDVLLVTVDTDEGVRGHGEAFGHASIRGTKATLDTLVAPLVVGRDPRDIAGLMGELMQRLHIFGRNGAVVYALSGIDIALWDIAGKLAGLPLYRLLGGAARSQLPAYASLARYEDPKRVAEVAAEAAAEGYHHVKLHEIGVPQVKAAREAIGPDRELILDTNCPWSVATALEMAEALRPYRLHWLEEPVWPPENHEGLARVRAAGAVLAAGENAAGLHDFRHMFEKGAIDIAQPSVTKIGGVTEMRKIVALAEAFGVRLVPHNAYFGAGSIASLHVLAALPAETLYERLYVELEAYPFGDWQRAKDGKVRVPDGPGLGCDPDRDVVERFRVEPDVVTR